MSADPGPDRKRKPQMIEGESSVVRGPWEDLPKTRRPPREPFFKRGPTSKGGSALKGGAGRAAGRGGREPLINSWRGLVLCLFLLFVAPPLAAFVGHFLMHSLFGAQNF